MAKNLETKLWFVTFFNANGQPVGPTIAAEWKIKPTRWANQAYAGAGYTYEIKQATPAEYEAWKEEN